MKRNGVFIDDGHDDWTIIHSSWYKALIIVWGVVLLAIYSYLLWYMI